MFYQKSLRSQKKKPVEYRKNVIEGEKVPFYNYKKYLF